MDLLKITETLVKELENIEFSSPVAYVYNPLVYAAGPHAQYLKRYGMGRKETVFVGMNPGPWGMTQTGIPFGEIEIVRNWLGIDGEVAKPPREHPKKRVEGFRCKRSEVSGRRLWGLFREIFGTPDKFFDRFFVVNYCPLLFLDADGRNITPDKLKSADSRPLFAACDDALYRTVKCLGPSHVVGVGNFAEAQIRSGLRDLKLQIGKILHPSPANPAANNGWKETVLKQLREQGVEF
ncbi:MAG TPA: uracil-DNA glycosylase family protein [Geobacteraceae bacterium]|nr:uracil-DNA glycosylase family protein [Geobacteraceae bacterium]